MKSCRHLEDIRPQIFARYPCYSLDLIEPLDWDRDDALLPPEDRGAIDIEKSRNAIERQVAPVLSKVGKGCLFFHDSHISGRLCHFCKAALSHFVQANPVLPFGKICDMKKVSRIHQSKRPVRRHYIAEWMDARNLSVADVIRELDVDKSQVYRWVKGQMPQPDMQERLAALFQIDPAALLRDPDDDWLSKFFSDKTEEQKERAIEMLKIMFPDDDKTGTNG